MAFGHPSLEPIDAENHHAERITKKRAEAEARKK
jgi:hypothetical protein